MAFCFSQITPLPPPSFSSGQPFSVVDLLLHILKHPVSVEQSITWQPSSIALSLLQVERYKFSRLLLVHISVSAPALW